MTPIHHVNEELVARYKEMLENGSSYKCDPFDDEYLEWMLDQIANHPEWPSDKAGRWMGFVQAIMCVRGFTTVEDERDFSRPLFHDAYAQSGISIPPTIQR